MTLFVLHIINTSVFFMMVLYNVFVFNFQFLSNIVNIFFRVCSCAPRKNSGWLKSVKIVLLRLESFLKHWCEVWGWNKIKGVFALHKFDQYLCILQFSYVSTSIYHLKTLSSLSHPVVKHGFETHSPLYFILSALL